MAFLKGKRAVIVGLASNRSIAWGIAQALRNEGAELAFSYQNSKLQGRVEKMASELDSNITAPMDVAEDHQINIFFKDLRKTWEGFDILVHSVAFAPSDQLEGGYLDSINREGFRVAHEISSYSLSALANTARPMMSNRNGAILTMSYLGAVRALPSYIVMCLAKGSLEASVRILALYLGKEGIRVNAISAGPMRTISGAAIAKAREIYKYTEKNSPLHRNVRLDELGNTALYFVSDLSKAVSGEIHYVDCGFNIIGMPQY